jgi:hypothetical protein
MKRKLSHTATAKIDHMEIDHMEIDHMDEKNSDPAWSNFMADKKDPCLNDDDKSLGDKGLVGDDLTGNYGSDRGDRGRWFEARVKRREGSEYWSGKETGVLISIPSPATATTTTTIATTTTPATTTTTTVATSSPLHPPLSAMIAVVGERIIYRPRFSRKT